MDINIYHATLIAFMGKWGGTDYVTILTNIGRYYTVCPIQEAVGTVHKKAEIITDELIRKSFTTTCNRFGSKKLWRYY